MEDLMVGQSLADTICERDKNYFIHRKHKQVQDCNYWDSYSASCWVLFLRYCQIIIVIEVGRNI